MRAADLQAAGSVTQTMLKFRACTRLPSPALPGTQPLVAGGSDTLPLLQLSRLSVQLSEPVQADAWLAVARTYDLVAVQPKSERAMQQVCPAPHTVAATCYNLSNSACVAACAMTMADVPHTEQLEH